MCTQIDLLSTYESPSFDKLYAVFRQTLCCSDDATSSHSFFTVGIGIGIKKTKSEQFVVTKLAKGWPAERSGHVREKVRGVRLVTTASRHTHTHTHTHKQTHMYTCRDIKRIQVSPEANPLSTHAYNHVGVAHVCQSLQHPCDNLVSSSVTSMAGVRRTSSST
jgi:hypothetical protein